MLLRRFVRLNLIGVGPSTQTGGPRRFSRCRHVGPQVLASARLARKLSPHVAHWRTFPLLGLSVTPCWTLSHCQFGSMALEAEDCLCGRTARLSANSPRSFCVQTRWTCGSVFFAVVATTVAPVLRPRVSVSSGADPHPQRVNELSRRTSGALSPNRLDSLDHTRCEPSPSCEISRAADHVVQCPHGGGTRRKIVIDLNCGLGHGDIRLSDHGDAPSGNVLTGEESKTSDWRVDKPNPLNSRLP